MRELEEEDRRRNGTKDCNLFYLPMADLKGESGFTLFSSSLLVFTAENK